MNLRIKKYCLNICRKAWITRWRGQGITQSEFPLWTAMHQKQKLDDFCRFNYFSSKSVKLFFPLLTAGSHSFKKNGNKFLCLYPYNSNPEPGTRLLLYRLHPRKESVWSRLCGSSSSWCEVSQCQWRAEEDGGCTKGSYCKNLIPPPPPPNCQHSATRVCQSESVVSNFLGPSIVLNSIPICQNVFSIFNSHRACELR